MKTRRRNLARLLVAIAMAVSCAHAVTIINRTTGQILFYDDFETASTVSTSAYPDVSGNYNPDHAKVGAWSVQETGQTNIQVAAYFGDGTNDPAATPQGTNYLRAVRHKAAVAEVDAVLPAIQDAEGDRIHLETMVWLPQDIDWGAFQIQVVGSAGSIDFRANVLATGAGANPSGVIRAWDATLATPDWVPTTLEWRINTWQKWEIDYAVGAETFDLTIDGVKKTLNRSGEAGDVKHVAFRAGSPNENAQFRMDGTGYTGVRQESFTLFRDGFEDGTPDSAPALATPAIGIYQSVGSGVKVRTGDLSASGGPAAACSGDNYVELSRLDNAGLSLSCMFAGGAVMPDAQELHARFMLWWDGAGLPGYGISRATTGYFFSTNFLAYNLIRGDASYDAHNGSAYVRIAPAGTIPKQRWIPVEITWAPASLLSTVSIDGGSAITNVLFGAVPEILNQFFLSSGGSTTVYWVDDIEVQWIYTPPPPPPPLGTLIRLR